MNQEKKAVCTTTLIVINIAVFLILTFLGDTEDTVFMLNHGAVYGPYISEGHQCYRLFTSLFLHFGIEHLLNNMVLLGALGWNLELETGRIKFLLIYFIAGLGGNLFSFWMNSRTDTVVVSAGASGAIFGLMGALLWVVIKNHGRVGRLTNRRILFMVALSLYFGFTSSGVDNAAHIGGLVCGFIAAVTLYHRKYHVPISAV
ncbi:MAG: rhomboid family intramembrane serine protease [Ruminococcus sp.]|nr:rhomboid family intramembrane serine protease [Ruminococcus sp.]